LSQLSPIQRQSLIASWRSLRSSGVTRKILVDLENASPSVKQLFYKAALVQSCFSHEAPTLDEHVKHLTRFFDDLIGQLDNETECLGLMRQIGREHGSLHVTFPAETWELLGEIAIERLSTAESVQKSRGETIRAWRVLIACLVDELRTGFESKARALSRKSLSTDQLCQEEESLGEQVMQLRLTYS